MPNQGFIALRDRRFVVRRARLSLAKGIWSIEVETDDEEYDHERWAPCLYHQGLNLIARNVSELTGCTSEWRDSLDSPHPEIGAMYVFGHHEVRNNKLSFGSCSAGRIDVSWSGMCDVFWSDPFAKDVPFSCVCSCEFEDASSTAASPK